MIVRRYEPKDFDQIKEWGQQWGVTYDEDQFPNVGFIIDGIGAYFLYQTDSTVCWLENMVTKRGVDPETKRKALDLLVDAILTEAKAQGFAVAYATTDIISVAKRARENGAGIRPAQFLITKDLTQPSHLQ